jgi:SAM-dependent methyltransferase
MLEQHRVWEDWARADPYWAILSDPDRKGGKWDVDEFYRSGVDEIRMVLGQLAARNLDLARGRCLDFGCGAGRLSQALAEEFEHVDGVDISETMVRMADEHNRYGDRCTFHLNTAPDLGLFDDGTFDFVFTTIVLQHNPPDLAEGYIRELVRVLAPNGVAVFDMPVRLRGVKLRNGSRRASVEVESGPGRLQPGDQATVTARVTNISGIDWPAGARLSLGNHWLSGTGELLVRDDGRSSLGQGLAAGDSERLELVVTAPKQPGDYRLVLDLVEEGVCWFGDRGSRTAEVAAPVSKASLLRRGDRAASGPAGDEGEPEPFQMHALRRWRVKAAVTESGGEIVDMVAHQTGGPDWNTFRYFVVRPGVAAGETG